MFPLVLVHPCSLQLTACHQGTPPTLGLLARRLCSSALHGLHWLWQQNVSWIQKFAALALPGIDPLKSLVQSRRGGAQQKLPSPQGKYCQPSLMSCAQSLDAEKGLHPLGRKHSACKTVERDGENSEGPT